MSFDCHLTVTCWCSTVFDIVRSSDDSNFDNPSNHFLPSDHSDHLETQLQQVCDDVHSKKSGQLHTAHTTVTVLSPCWLTYAASSKYLQWPMCNSNVCWDRKYIRICWKMAPPHHFCVHWAEADSVWAAASAPPSHGSPPRFGDWATEDSTSHSLPLLLAAPERPPSGLWRRLESVPDK